jgi:hypothetical protein
MKYLNPHMKLSASLAGLALAAALVACDNPPPPTVNSLPVLPPVSGLNTTDAQRLTSGASKLIDAMKRPTQSFHFSYKGKENINSQYPQDKSQFPRVGPVVLQADISPEEISVTETRGSTTKTSKAKDGDELNWSMANLATLGVMTNPTLVIAVGASVTSPPTTDLVGVALADKFTFDTTTADTSSQKMALERARMVVTTIKDCKGTAWIAKDSGLLIKFNLDADYLDKLNHAWQEHYEGEVTPK